MTVYIDNTNTVRVVNAVSTALDGSVVPLSEAGTFTVTDLVGVEVVGQVWPTTLTLNEPGSYAGCLESDLEFEAGKSYTLHVEIGSDTANFASWTMDFKPEVRD